MKGVCFVVALILTAMTGCFVYTPITTIPLVIWVHLLGRKKGIAFDALHRWNNWIQGSWFLFVSWLLQRLLHVRYDISLANARGELIDRLLQRPTRPGKFNIVIANHRTRIDWMLLWPLFAQTDLLFTLKIVLKGELSSMPLFGWTMQTFRFLFLSRKWDVDRVHLDKIFAYMKRHGERATFLIFPEGTDLSPSNVAKSSKYAADNGLPVFQHVLNPRLTGLLAMKNMIGVENIENVFDVTMGYTDHPIEGRPSEASIINGRMPRKVHLLVSSHKVGAAGDIPADDEGFKAWIEKQFEKKELMLSDFYNASPCQFDPLSVKRAFGPSSTTTVDTKRNVQPSMWSIVLSVVMWVIPTAYVWVWQLLVQRNLWLLLHVVVASGLYVMIGKRFGGVDKWLMFR